MTLFASILLTMTAFAGALDGDPGWTRDPSLVPWETMTTAGDGARQPARTAAEVARRRALAKTALDRAGTSNADRARALAELGDLFRDEARIVLQQDANDPWRVPLRTSPAWLQLELAARRYAEALALDPASVDGEGRLSLLQAVIAARLDDEGTFDETVRIIRTYRGTPYVEMAKLAVGDHHQRTGDLDRARAAYRLVRGYRDVELASYARYRLASVHAAAGEHAAATGLLQEIVAEPNPGPLLDMLRDAARSALANELARDLPLLDLVRWIDGACPRDDHACRRDVRSAAADTLARARDDRGEAWLRTVDATPELAERLDDRLALARRMLADEPVETVLLAAEDTCSPTDDPCRAEQAHAVMRFYDLAADPDGGWLPSYLRLPRMRGRPDVQRAAATLARTRRPPSAELAAFETLCAPSDAGCLATIRTHLRALYARLDRLNDAAWMRFVEEGLPLGDDSASAAHGQQLVRTRARAPALYRAFVATCADAACRAETIDLLVGYFVAIGEEDEADWLVAIQALPTLPIAPPMRDALREAAIAGHDARTTLLAMLATCGVPTRECFDEANRGASTFFRAAGRHADNHALDPYGFLATTGIDPRIFPDLIVGVLDDRPVAELLAIIETRCAGLPDACGPRARAGLAAYYGVIERHADRLTVERLDAGPDLGAWGRLEPAFLRVVRTATDPREASDRAADLCTLDGDACRRTLREALVAWYEAQGRPDDARIARAAARAAAEK